MKRTIIFLFIILIITAGHAQNAGLKGKLISGNNPVDFANIVLQLPDSSFVTGLVSDQRGNFTINNLNTGDYLLCVSCIGYEPQQLAITNLSTIRDLGSIQLDAAAIALDEITVTAANIITTIDKNIVLPTAHQLRASTDGLHLLQQMKLSRLYIDPIRQTITASGEGEVQLRINGVKAEVQEVMAIRPKDVIRIEYHDDPSLRYGEGTAVVVDYIVRHRETGGYVSLNLQNSPHVVFGNNGVNAKINHKKSEFAIGYYGGYRSFNAWRVNKESFIFEDGNRFTRLEAGIPQKADNNWENLRINYSYQEPDKWYFNATLRGHSYYWKQRIHSELYPEDKPDDNVDMRDYNKEKSMTPSLDLYFQRSFRNKQTLILNTVGTYIGSENERTYQERKEGNLLTDIYSSTNGDRYSFIGEGIYEKGFGKSKLNTGIYFRQSNTNNTYKGNTNAKTELQESVSSLYVEYTGKINRFSYSAGVRGNRTHIEQGEKTATDLSLMPQVRLSYQFNDQLQVRYRGNISRSTPSLSDLSNVEQLIDSLQLRKGNPDLKMTTKYKNNLYLNYRKGLVNGNLSIQYDYQQNPVMECTYRENNLFIRTIDNQKSWYRLTPELELKVGPIKDIVTLSFTTGLNHFKSHGNDYTHVYNNWYYVGELMANYKNYSLFFQTQNHRNHFYGETVNYGENYHSAGVMYRHKQMSFGLLSFNPFMKNYKGGSENFNQLAPSKNWHYLKESSRLFLISFTWNFSFGRSVDSSVQKRLNHEDSDSGVMKAGK